MASKSFRRLPSLPSESETPRTKSPRLSILNESPTNSYQSHRSPERSQTNKNKFNRNESSILSSKFKRERGIKNDIDLELMDDNDPTDNIEKSFSAQSKKHQSLDSINETSREQKQISGKRIPTTFASYSQLVDEEHDDDDDDDDYDYNETEETHILTTNINDTTTVSSNKRRKVFRRTRSAPKTMVDGKFVAVADASYGGQCNETTEISMSATTKSKLSNKPCIKQRAAALSTLTSKFSSNVSEYSMKEELNLQQIIINATAEMHASVASPQTISKTSKTELSGEGALAADEEQSDLKQKQKRNETINGFEFYFKLRNMMSLLTLTGIGTMQVVYYRYYYLCVLFTGMTCLFYFALFVPMVFRNLSESDWCSFSLIVIRLFHIVSLLLIFGGVETCLWHYERAMDEINNEYDKDLDSYGGLLWMFIIVAMVLCYLQNVYVIKYVEYIVVKWKLIYCRKETYYMDDDGIWGGDVNPISGGDGLLIFLLFMTTFGAITTAVVCITEMEQDITI